VGVGVPVAVAMAIASSSAQQPAPRPQLADGAPHGAGGVAVLDPRLKELALYSCRGAGALNGH